jgi:hypothetical protein
MHRRYAHVWLSRWMLFPFLLNDTCIVPDPSYLEKARGSITRCSIDFNLVERRRFALHSNCAALIAPGI